MRPQDNRKGLRIDVRIPAAVQLESRRVEGEILNLSEGGAYVHCDVEWKVGQSVRIELQFRGTVVLAGKATSWEELRGRTVHSAPKAQKSHSPIPELPKGMEAQSVIRWKMEEAIPSDGKGFGVEFTDLDPTNREVIRKVILYYENLRRAGVNFE